ncbi:UDP-galactose transporter-like protein [Dinothrombium tinctorium]|uniref:UDP-galactose transporter-like protein n=1 Tax=Dinothrombium tinctorium TaxID=1965070 RepID=A0A3S3Q4K3_9ACAR|nr:UDP-galactose transporter-like protein [Dinothrombium tinctorium]RWS03399.1 UDP-galactose transporter-like protein [Dinothrombium tinctorium]RWS17956.1 UDP-galactose transporter-like protein [Dinothrombium tinctorium]
MHSKIANLFESNVWNNLFPNKLSSLIFISYMVLFINQGLLVTATKTADNKYTYSTIAAVFFTECTKLFIAISIYLRDKKLKELVPDLIASKNVFALYFVPAFLYCVYNNLAFVNLQSFDPTTYYLLLQFRVVVTGIIYQILFKRKLSNRQWFSLILLTCGCIVKNFGQMKMTSSSFLSFSILLILFQVFCSCFAGVYNELLLKDNNTHIMIQNIYMYSASIFCNFMVYCATNYNKMDETFSVSILENLLQPLILAVIVNNALCGIVTSIFLKNLNSILKTFASALELVFTAIFCWILFHIAIDMYTIVAIAIVSYATFLYSRNPVVNRPLPSSLELKTDEEQVDLISENNRKSNVDNV